MRLLDVKVVLDREKGIPDGTLPTEVWKELDEKTTEYAVLSHRWENEVDHDTMTGLTRMDEGYRNEVRERVGYKKIVKSCKQALQDGYKWIWIDACCIDKRSSSEHSEAINSMYRWYHRSQKCYAYLSDVEDSFPTRQDFSKFDKTNGWPAWFSRGWTLQELIAPKRVEFFNKYWVYIGEKESLAKTLEKITRIPLDVLKEGRIPRRLCVAEIMSWAADRQTTRVEDRAYSLLGLFGVNMPVLYGEGERAFRRLQLEIIRRSSDQSIFAWNLKGQFGQLGSVLAGSPSDFRGCHDVEKVEFDQFINEITYYRQNGLGIPGSSKLACMRSGGRALRSQLAVRLVTNVGVQVCLPVIPHRDSESVFRAILACRDYYGKLITIDLKSIELSSYRIPAAERFQQSRPKLRSLYLAYSAPYPDEEYHHFKLDDRHASYYGFIRRGTFPREFTGDTVTFSSLTNDLVSIVYANDDGRSRFAVALGYYLGQVFVHVVYDECSAGQEVPWMHFSKRVYDMLWAAPVEHRAGSGVKCAHLPGSIWDARVIWYAGDAQTNVTVDVEQCPGCCSGPRERTTTSNDRYGLDMPGLMKTVHRGCRLRLDGKDASFCQCSGQSITLGDYGDYCNGNFERHGNIFEGVHALGIDPADPAYRPSVSCVSGDADVLHRKQDRHDQVEEFRLQGEYLTLRSPKGLSLPNNRQLVLLLKALSMRLSGKCLVTTIIQCSDCKGANSKGDSMELERDLSSTTGGYSAEPGVIVPLYTIASPQVWRREPACARRREHFKSIRKHFYMLANLPEAGDISASRWKSHRAVKFLSDIFGLENLQNYTGEITFFQGLSKIKTQPLCGSAFLRYTDTVTAGDSLLACLVAMLCIPFKSRVLKYPHTEVVSSPLLEKCKAFGPQVGSRRYIAARQQALHEVESISQTLGVMLLEHIHTTILDASEDEMYGDRDTIRRSVDTHSILQDIRALQTTLDATDDDDEQRVLEEDVTGQILWLSWCGILSEVEQRLPEVVNYIRREGNTTTPEGRDCVRQGLREIGEIIRKALHAPMDDDVAHLRRIMLDAGAGLSKHHLWLAARAAEQDQWSSVTSSRNNNTFIRHAHVSAVHRTLGIGIGTI